MKTLIIGAGAVGIGVAAGIYGENSEIAFVAKGRTAETIAANGIKRIGIFGELSVPASNTKVYSDIADIDTAYDYCIISTKTMENETIAKKLVDNKRVLSTGGKIILFQNGWGNNDAFLKYFEKEQLYNARVITGFERPEPNISRVTVHTAPILLGSIYGCDNSVMEPLAAKINASGIESAASADILKAIWAKMLFNTTLNPLGAILNVTYGELSEMPHSVQIMNLLIDETYSVLDAYGYTTFWETADEYRKNFYEKLVPDTYKHRSSTLQDIEKGNPTEIDTLNGCIIKLAEKKGIKVPTHFMIYNLIKTIEEKTTIHR